MLIFILVNVFVSVFASLTLGNSPDPDLSALVKERTGFYAKLIGLLREENIGEITRICEETDKTKLLCTNSEIDFKQLVKGVIHLQQKTGIRDIFKYFDSKSSVDKKTESKLRLLKLAASDRENASKDFENVIADMLKRINDLKNGVTLEKRTLPNEIISPVAEPVAADNPITSAPEDTPEIRETNTVETTVHEGERLPAVETGEERRKVAKAIWYGLAAVLAGALGAGLYFAGFVIAWATIIVGVLAMVGVASSVIGPISLIGCDCLSHCLAKEIANPIIIGFRDGAKKIFKPVCTFPGKWLLGLSRESYERMKQSVLENAGSS